MDFKDQIKQHSERVEKLVASGGIQTEEATKTALVMPFIQILGYDVFNPVEVIPEYTCDIGLKKGEKVDYAIMQNENPILLVECKHLKEELSLHDNQLLRYFHTSTAKFGVLTNGIEYKFYTDLEEPNKMDEKPFLRIDITNIKDHQVEELKKFHKSYFDLVNILSSAEDLKYTQAIRTLLHKEFNSPSEDFVRFIAKQVQDKPCTAKVIEMFSELTKKSVQAYINDLITERIKSALTKNVEKVSEDISENEEIVEDDGIVTTMEEIEGFMIVKSILRESIDIQRIIYRDTKRYFGIFLDNQRKTLCRLYFNSERKKSITIPDENKKETRYEIDNLDDIYKCSKELIKSFQRLEAEE